jgi:hypothetical protein
MRDILNGTQDSLSAHDGGFSGAQGDGKRVRRFPRSTNILYYDSLNSITMATVGAGVAQSV